MAVAALVMRIIVFFKYQKGNKTKTESGKTSKEVAEEALKKAGLTNVKVKKANWLRAFFFGNSYSLSKKTIFLRRGIYEKDSITAVGMALQKVGVAKMCEDGGIARTRNIMQILSLFGPILFIPSVVIGFLIDYFIFTAIGIFSIVGIAIGVVILLSGFIATMLNIPVEKKANNMAMKIVEETQVLNKQEREVLKQVFDAYIIAYICEFIVAVLRIVQMVLEIVMNSQISNKKS